jgi:hypothetical protein
MRKVFAASFLVTLLFATAVRADDAPGGLEIHGFQRYMLDDPLSGPIETIVNTDHATISRGALMDVFVAVQNHSNDTTAGVVIDLDLRYADGALVTPFHLGADREQTLGPDEGVGFFIFWQIPADAPLGTASFTACARVTRLTGGSDGHQGNQNPMVACDSVTFEVTP